VGRWLVVGTTFSTMLRSARFRGSFSTLPPMSQDWRQTGHLQDARWVSFRLVLPEIFPPQILKPGVMTRSGARRGSCPHCMVLPYALGCWLRHSPRAHSIQTLWLLPHGRVRGSVKSIKQTCWREGCRRRSMVLL
jgi:hypothetical protein